MLRRLLIVCAAVIALFANFLRAVFLVRIAATENLSEVSRWHDIAGYSIIAFVFVRHPGSRILAREITSHRSEVGDPNSESALGNRQLAIGNSRLLPNHRPSAGSCSSRLEPPHGIAFTNAISSAAYLECPVAEQAPNFRKLKIDNEIRAVLRFDEGDAAAWTISSPVNATEPKIVPCSLYVFRWNPGKNSALLANLHRPDVCLPASGWTQVADHEVRSYPISSSVELPFRHFEFQRRLAMPRRRRHMHFIVYRKIALRDAPHRPQHTNLPGMSGNRSEWTRAERVRDVLEGRRHLGQQAIEAIFISGEPFSATEAETHLRDFVRNVISLSESENRR